MTAPSACVPDLGVLSEKEEEILKDDRCVPRSCPPIRIGICKYIYIYIKMTWQFEITISVCKMFPYIYIYMYMWFKQQTQRFCIARGVLLRWSIVILTQDISLCPCGRVVLEHFATVVGLSSSNQYFQPSTYSYTMWRCIPMRIHWYTCCASLNQQNVVLRIFKVCWDWISLTSNQPALVLQRFYHISSWDHAMMLWMSRRSKNWALHMCCLDCMDGRCCSLQDPWQIIWLDTFDSLLYAGRTM